MQLNDASLGSLTGVVIHIMDEGDRGNTNDNSFNDHPLSRSAPRSTCDPLDCRRSKEENKSHCQYSVRLQSVRVNIMTLSSDFHDIRVELSPSSLTLWWVVIENRAAAINSIRALIITKYSPSLSHFSIVLDSPCLRVLFRSH